MSLKKKKKGNVNNVPKSKKIQENSSPHPSLTQLQFQSEIQVQKMSLKKKRKGTLVTFPNQKKIKENSSPHPLLTQLQFQSEV
jgi:hypothetical protein